MKRMNADVTDLAVLHANPAAAIIPFSLNIIIVYLRRDELVAFEKEFQDGG